MSELRRTPFADTVETVALASRKVPLLRQMTHPPCTDRDDGYFAMSHMLALHIMSSAVVQLCPVVIVYQYYVHATAFPQ